MLREGRTTLAENGKKKALRMEKGGGGIYTTLVEKNMSNEQPANLSFLHSGQTPSVSHEVSLLLNLPL
jgi:hypothetical protein